MKTAKARKHPTMQKGIKSRRRVIALLALLAMLITLLLGNAISFAEGETGTPPD